ncbi:MAG: histidine kinase [Chitinophagaceae bacterium]|nr:histidine kinase [Chitinophagaceae bacterium]MBL0272403.1 histidine kinase [Chitinophagaceae bacterium]
MWFANSRYWLFQAIGWGGFTLISIFFAYSFDQLNTRADVIQVMGRIGIFVALGIILTHLMRLVIINLNLLQKKLEKQLFQFILITAIFSLVGSFFDMQLLIQSDWLNKREKPFLDNKVLLVLSGAFSFFIYYFIWNAIYFMYHYISKSRKQQLDTLQLEALVKELELKTIKAHINPHFIFNSLNSIRALVDENPQRARKAITELSNILRSSMQTEKVEMVAFEKELFIVKDYLALENMRFEDRLKVEYEIDEDTLHQPVPPMMLQTLVENAIKHGISKQINGGIVKVISDFKGDYHELVVQNTGQLNGSVNAEGFGISSTNNRLNLLYGDKARFDIKQINGSLVEARVLLPVTTH